MKIAIALLLSSAALLAVAPKSNGAEASSGSRLFEMRTYITHDGRLDALNQRFSNHTNRLFAKHGIDIVGFWVPTTEPESTNTLVYIIAFPSREAREASWKAFQADPEWKAAKEASEKDGPIVKKVISQFMTPTDYSPIK
jgi:hypothetical protein